MRKKLNRILRVQAAMQDLELGDLILGEMKLSKKMQSEAMKLERKRKAKYIV